MDLLIIFINPPPTNGIGVDKWSVVYKKAIQDDGSLLFPERLTKEFLSDARRTMGSLLFANQYQNTVIDEADKKFKKEWLRYYSSIPQNVYKFAFIDPAIGQHKHNDYTGIAVVCVDDDGNWYAPLLARYRLTPTQIVNKLFELHDIFKFQAIGIEIVAYQEALMYMLSEEMGKRKRMIPVKGITRNSVSKASRILGLVPRFEWGRLAIAQGMTDFEDEYNSFPRSSHDDIFDALASIEEIAFAPEKEKIRPVEKPHSAHDPNHEKWAIQQMIKKHNEEDNYG